MTAKTAIFRRLVDALNGPLEAVNPGQLFIKVSTIVLWSSKCQDSSWNPFLMSLKIILSTSMMRLKKMWV